LIIDEKRVSGVNSAFAWLKKIDIEVFERKHRF